MKIHRVIAVGVVVAGVSALVWLAAGRYSTAAGATAANEGASEPGAPEATLVAGQMAVPSVSYFKVVTPEGYVSYEPMTDDQAHIRLAEMMNLHKEDAATFKKQKEEWDKAFPDEPFPVPPLPAPKIVQMMAVPADPQERKAALIKLRQSPKTWTVFVLKEGEATKVMRTQDETFGAFKTQLFDKYRKAALAEKQRREDEPNSEPVAVPRPSIEVLGMFLSDADAAALIAKQSPGGEAGGGKATEPGTSE